MNAPGKEAATDTQPAITAADIREFNRYLRACTDRQVRDVYEKEQAAGRDAYAELARSEAAHRRIDVG